MDLFDFRFFESVLSSLIFYGHDNSDNAFLIASLFHGALPALHIFLSQGIFFSFFLRLFFGWLLIR